MSEIKLIRPADWEALRELLGEGHAELRQAAGGGFAGGEPCTEETMRWLGVTAGDGLFGLYEDGLLKGMCSAQLAGREGWVGVIAIARDAQGLGYGRQLLEHAIPYFLNKSAETVGLEGPATPHILGLLGRLGFSPTAISLNLEIPVDSLSDHMDFWVDAYSAVPESQIKKIEDYVRKIVTMAAPGRDYLSLVRATKETGLGESFVFSEGDEPTGLAIVHNFQPYPGEAEDAVTVLKLVCHVKKNVGRLDQVLAAIGAYARAQGKKNIRLRCLSDDPVTYQYLLSRGFRVRESHVRLTLEGYPEVRHAGYVVFSNWGL